MTVILFCCIHKRKNKLLIKHDELYLPAEQNYGFLNKNNESDSHYISFSLIH